MQKYTRRAPFHINRLKTKQIQYTFLSSREFFVHEFDIFQQQNNWHSENTHSTRKSRVDFRLVFFSLALFHFIIGYHLDLLVRSNSIGFWIIALDSQWLNSELKRTINWSTMDKDAMVPVGAFVIISFLLIGLIFMGCMLYWNWSHRKQRAADISDNISNRNPCIYEKTNPRTYNRSSNGIITK